MQRKTFPSRAAILSFWAIFFFVALFFLGDIKAKAAACPTSGTATIGTYSTGGTAPNGITYDPVDHAVWVANYTGETVSEIDVTDGHIIGTYSVGTGIQRPRGIAFDPVTPAIWVTNWYGDNFIKMSTSGSILRTVTLPYTSSPLGIAYDPNTQSIWVSGGGSGVGTLYRTGVASNSLTTLPALGGNYNTPKSLDFDPVNNSMWVSLNWQSAQPTGPGYDWPNIVNSYYSPYRYYGFLAKVSNTIVSSNYYTLGMSGPGYQIFAPIDSKYHGDVVYNPVTQSVWMANTTYNNILAMSTADGSILGRYSSGVAQQEGPVLGNAPSGMAYNPSSQSMWVTGSGNTVTRMDASNGNIIAQYRVGTNPNSVAYDSYTDSIWVTNANDGTVSKLCIDSAPAPTCANGGLTGASCPTGTWTAPTCPASCSDSTPAYTCVGGNGFCSVSTPVTKACTATLSGADCPTGTWTSDNNCPSACGYAGGNDNSWSCTGGNNFCSPATHANTSCSATPACPPSTPVLSALWQGSSYLGALAPAYDPAGYDLYATASSPSGANLNYYFEWSPTETAQWSGWVGSGGSGGVNHYVDAAAGTYYARAWAYDANGNWSILPSDWFTITLTTVAPTVSCSGTPGNPYVGQPVTWSSVVTGGSRSYSYSWSGTDGLTGTTANVSKSYSGIGQKSASLIVTDSRSSLTGSAVCTTGVNQPDGPTDGGTCTTGVCPGTCTASLSPNPDTIEQGGNINLTWGVTGGALCAASCTGNGFNTGGAISGTVAASVLPAPPTTAYAVTCSGGTYGPPPPVNTTVTVLVPVATITANGQSSSIRVNGTTANNVSVAWSSAHTTSCFVTKNNAAWQTGVTSAGISDSVTSQTVYKIDCVNKYGTHATASVIANILSRFNEF